MNAREMHYDYKQKLNKIDSNKYRDLVVPEIDWKLNEAQKLFVQMTQEPRLQKELGFEITQRSIDEVRTIIINQTLDNGVKPTVFTDDSYLAVLPENYWYLLNVRLYGTKGNCKVVRLKSRQVQHDDEHEDSFFDKSSFEWRVANVRFMREGLRIFTDKTFKIDTVCFEYIKELSLIHNAQDYEGGSYVTLGGQTLIGSQDCELPRGTHSEVVDLAVFITATDLALPDTQLKRNKLALTN